jgi:hypothetical protein
MSKPRKFAVGQRIWMFDYNHRFYAKSGDGAPIYEKHFRPFTVVGIESRSYLIRRGDPDEEPIYRCKPEKVGFDGAEKLYVTDDGKSDMIWLNDHRHNIVRMVEKADPETLKKVAELIGYRPDAETNPC